ncbi:hypothetical protein [Deefgea sp. CFH1-16]|uniref:hypothetical protein n=1 Tax=Deefgea sp. CFH1-16 TaxID=2675457 RepID=UPI0015F6A170|nr:hypothetical protein [Deefgea sp. CFH1-16]MBM5575789.1 hypothetical protein [Deefgea sp. CFH1-16]
MSLTLDLKAVAMKDAKIKELNAQYSEIDEEIERMERDYRNYQGGITAWTSGRDVHLTASAKKKIESLRKKQDNTYAKLEKLAPELFGGE